MAVCLCCNSKFQHTNCIFLHQQHEHRCYYCQVKCLDATTTVTHCILNHPTKYLTILRPFIMVLGLDIDIYTSTYNVRPWYRILDHYLLTRTMPCVPVMMRIALEGNYKKPLPFTISLLHVRNLTYLPSSVVSCLRSRPKHLDGIIQARQTTHTKSFNISFKLHMCV